MVVLIVLCLDIDFCAVSTLCASSVTSGFEVEISFKFGLKQLIDRRTYYFRMRHQLITSSAAKIQNNDS